MLDMSLKKHLWMSQYWYLPYGYFIGVKPLVGFRLTNDAPHNVLKSKLNNIMQYIDKRNVVKIEYRSPSIDIEWKIGLNKFELNTNGDFKVTWNTYHWYETKGLIEVFTTIVRSVDDIIHMLKCSESFSIVQVLFILFSW